MEKCCPCSSLSNCEDMNLAGKVEETEKKKKPDDELDKVIKENHEMPTRFSAVGLKVWSHIKDRNRGRFHLQ